jgi:hypothetical protein
MDMDKLNEVYEEVLGTGPALEEVEDAGAAPAGKGDAAYSQEDYGDDTEDGIDPRDASTAIEDKGAVETEDEEFESEEVDDEEYEDIPERLVEAGRAGNLSERDIIELSETHPEVLEALARAQEAQPAAPPQQQKSVQKETTQEAPAGSFEPLKLDFDDDDMDELGERSVKIISTLVDKVNSLGSQVAEQGQATKGVLEQGVQDKIRAIDETFDTMCEDIPALGATATLTADQKANRVFAFNAARAAMGAYGDMSLEQALTVGANALRGQQTDTQVKAKIISGLNKNKKRFISRGRGQKKAPPRKSVDERALESINRVLDDPKYHSQS